MYKTLCLIIVLMTNFANCQNISYNKINTSYINLQTNLGADQNYFKSNNYFQAKFKEHSIRLYEGLGNNAIITFSNKADFTKFALEIMNNAYFDFKFCSDYNNPVVFNFHSDSNNKFRFNFDEHQVSVEYPNNLSEFVDSHVENLPVFCCSSDGAYAYHPNLRCENLNLCKSKIFRSSIRDASKSGYKLCQVCSSLK